MNTDQATPHRPEIASYRDYRAYLRDLIVFLKATRRGFSYRSFSRAAGYSSPNFLKQVADGKRNLSPESIARFARGLGLDDHEHNVFETLVLLNQARTDDERNRYYARLRSVVRLDGVGRIESDQYELYTHWYTLVIRELVAMDEFVEDVARVARRLMPRIRPPQAQKALALLERLGLVVRDDDGELKVAHRKLSTGPRVRSLAIRNFHRRMLELASKSLDAIPSPERDVTSLTVPMSDAQYERARKLLARVRTEILELSEEPADGPVEIHQIMFALFPVTREPWK